MERFTERQREDIARESFRRLSTFDAVMGRVYRHVLVLAGLCAVGVLLYSAGVFAGFRAAATTDGSMRVAGLRDRVTIVRDGRDVPHVTASSTGDLLFAQGFAEGSDRLFQMELTRRYALGTLSEVLGAKALAMDESQRYYDVRDIAERQWRHLSSRDRAGLVAFSAGVNEAMRVQPLPVEFRLLLYRPQPWRPQDSIAVSLAVSIALADTWHDVLARDEVWRRGGSRAFDATFPLSDPAYDVTLRGMPAQSIRRVAAAPQIARGLDSAARVGRGVDSAVAVGRVADAVMNDVAARRPRAGSNAWAVGASRSLNGRALLANDPHLDLTIPGLWYLQDLRAPGIHVAGASIPGAPGVLLGHNERIAWGATNGDATSMSVYRASHLDARAWVRETFRVRFARNVDRGYYRTAREFGVPDPYADGATVLVRWPLYASDGSSVPTFLALDRARSAAEAVAVLSHYRGTAENFVVADSGGRVAYHLAGTVANDEAWGRYVHASSDLERPVRALPYAGLPALAPARDAVVVSANNKMYGAGYPYRLSASFEPPYRAFRIAQLLRARGRYDAAYFAEMQLDTVSPVDLEFARTLSAYALKLRDDATFGSLAHRLAAWDGSFSPASRTATLEHTVRARMESSGPSLYAVLQRLRAQPDDPNVDADLRGMLSYSDSFAQAWGRAGAVRIEHPLAPLRFGFLNGVTLPGEGDEYTIHLQEPGFSQSFRAVWDVGNWDAGGIVIPSGESGEPGSGHYDDLADTWISGDLVPLPFGDRAVAASARATLSLLPR